MRRKATSPRTEHRNAVAKMVREKRMILIADLGRVMNNKNISSPVEYLVKEGKIKRQKIKVRGQVGNMTNQWLIYDNSVTQNEILDFERETINRTFQSPLVENHCYKSPDQPIDQELKDENSLKNSNIIDMQEYVRIKDLDVGIMTYNGKRVVTFEDIEELHKRPKGTAKRTFSDHKNKLIEGVDYFSFKGKEGREALIQANCTRYVQLNSSPNFKSYLLTESGYLLLVKPFTDDLSWEIQRDLVNKYFQLKEIKENINNNVPVTKQDINSIDTFDFFKMVATGMTNLDDRVKTLESTIDSMKKAITG